MRRKAKPIVLTGQWSTNGRIFYWPNRQHCTWTLTRIGTKRQAMLLLGGLTRPPADPSVRYDTPYIDFGDGVWDFPHYKFKGVWKYKRRA